MKVIQFNLRAFFSVRTWPWMMLFYKLRPMLRSAQVEKELAALNEDFTKLKDAFDRSVSACPNRPHQSPSLPWFIVHFSPRCEVKRREAEDRQVVLVQEKNDLTLQLQAVSQAPAGICLQGSCKMFARSRNFSHRDTFPGTNLIPDECSRSFCIKHGEMAALKKNFPCNSSRSRTTWKTRKTVATS